VAGSVGLARLVFGPVFTCSTSSTAVVAPRVRPQPARSAFPMLANRMHEGRSVARVMDLLREMGRRVPQPGRVCAKLKRKHADLSSDDVFQAPRVGARRGGRPEWVATKRALIKLFHDA
jgi:hypothetical protein